MYSKFSQALTVLGSRSPPPGEGGWRADISCGWKIQPPPNRIFFFNKIKLNVLPMSKSCHVCEGGGENCLQGFQLATNDYCNGFLVMKKCGVPLSSWDLRGSEREREGERERRRERERDCWLARILSQLALACACVPCRPYTGHYIFFPLRCMCW